MQTEVDKICGMLGRDEVMAQMAEECAELSHAALKLRRVLDGTNPTPITKEEAEDNLQEEMGDVLVCMLVAGLEMDTLTRVVDQKLRRWVDRLENIYLD